MPRYFFDLHDPHALRDETGLDLPDLAAVRAEARRALAGLAADRAGGQDAIRIRTDIRDAAGRPVLRVSLVLDAEPVEASG